MNKQKVTIVSVVVVFVVGAAIVLTPKSAPEQASDPSSLDVPHGQQTPAVSAGAGSLATSPTATPMDRTIALTISSPVNGATVSTQSITVSGKTSPNAEVFVNESETRADAAGNFSVQMSLDEGDNYIIVVANDADGNAAEAELTVIYSP